MKVVLFGANGFLGRSLALHFLSRGYHVVAVARHDEGITPGADFIRWDGVTLGDWVDAMEGSRAVINLAGRTVNCRYTTQNKAQILESRVVTTKLIGEGILKLRVPPEVWVNSSTATIYNHRERNGTNGPHTEVNGEIGDDFSMRVAKAWEEAFFNSASGVRKVAARTAIVLGAEKKMVFDMLSRITKLGLGGKMGSGEQMVSWIHEEDFCHAMEFLVMTRELDGAVNIASPHPESNEELMSQLRTLWGVPVGLPAKKWMLKVGTYLMRTEAELVLKSRWVIPKRLLDTGFEYVHPHLKQALTDLKVKME